MAKKENSIEDMLREIEQKERENRENSERRERERREERDKLLKPEEMQYFRVENPLKKR